MPDSHTRRKLDRKALPVIVAIPILAGIAFAEPASTATALEPRFGDLELVGQQDVSDDAATKTRR
jgi:hypothetical protein